MVFFVIDLKTRRVEIAGICPSPAEPWMKQVARNLTDCDDGFLRGIRYLILDRDPLYTSAFRAMLKDAGVTPLLLPARSPNPNAERFVLSVKSECLRKLVPLSERHLRHAIRQYAAHYHHERHHQGLAGQLVVPDEHAGSTGGHVARRERLGGLLNFYYREAA
jgi:putative transposase